MVFSQVPLRGRLLSNPGKRARKKKGAAKVAEKERPPSN
jgi:hypothetical protein